VRIVTRRSSAARLGVERSVRGPVPTGPDAFLSYAREDSDFVAQLVATLTRHGKEVWRDVEAIPPAADWAARIRAGIAQARAPPGAPSDQRSDRRRRSQPRRPARGCCRRQRGGRGLELGLERGRRRGSWRGPGQRGQLRAGRTGARHQGHRRDDARVGRVARGGHRRISRALPRRDVGQSTGVSDVDVSSDGTTILAATGDGRVHLYSCAGCADPQALPTLAARRSTRSLSPFERDRYLPQGD
jgi:TIR domain